MIGQTTPEPDPAKPAPAPQPAPDPEVPAKPGEDNAAQETDGKEYGGRDGLDPTRYGDWEKNGRCIDF